MKTPDLTNLLVFKNIFEKKNMTVVAELMGLSKPAISKRLDILEKDLGSKLFVRTTRAITPTDEANQLIHKVNDIFERVDNLNASFSLSQNLKKKKLRISCVASMSQKFLGMILKEYQKNHSGIEIELIVTDSILDPVEHNIDLMIRANPNKNSNLTGRKIGNYNLYFVATPKYLKKNKPIKNINDLLAHEILVIDKHLSVFDKFSKNLKLELLSQRKFITNDSPLVYQLLMSNQGIAVRSTWDIKDEVKNKKLDIILHDKMSESAGEVWVLGNSSSLQNNIVRDVYNYLIAEVGKYLETEVGR